MDPLKVLTGPCTFKSLTPCNLSTCTKKQILEYFENSYSLNESVFTVVACKDAFYKCPDRLRLPLIFYYGHTAAVYVNKLILAGLIKDRINLEYETMFETGVDEMSWDDTENYRMGGSYQWPHLDKVVEFRAKVRQVIRHLIQEMPLDLPVTQDSPWWAVFMGMDHERIHVETSSVLIRQLPIHMVHRPMGWTIAPKTKDDGISKNPLVLVEQKEITIGKSRDFPTYGWDNEYPEIKKRVPSFEASAYLITNKQYLHFVNNGGYKNKEWWSSEGWQWCTYRKAQHPTFWVCRDGCISNNGAELAGYSHCKPLNNNQEADRNRCNCLETNNEQLIEKYRLRTICEEIDMPWDWPVVVNYHEAKAYCNWLGQGYRLLTEAEHHAIRNPEPSSSKGASAEFSLSSDLDKKYNFNLHYGSSTPVNMYPPTESGFYDVFGNVWEWTEDHFNGLPGFKTHAFYDDFSTPTFDGRHNVIMGGSWVSSGTQAARYGRYAFRRHFVQHAGFRIAHTVDATEDPPVTMVPEIDTEDQETTIQLHDVNKHMVPSTNTQLEQESSKYLQEQLQMEYNTQGNFFEKLSSACIETMKRLGGNFSKALDLGCGCGRLTFTLAQHFQKVLGSDVCGQFINAAEQLTKQNGCLSYHIPKGSVHPTSAKQPKIDGNTDLMQARVPVKLDPAKVAFKQFTWIPNELNEFDFIVQHDVERLQNKKAWLLRLGEIIVPTGVVMIVCTDDWTEEDILPVVKDRLKLLESKKMTYNEAGQQKSVVLTVWHRA